MSILLPLALRIVNAVLAPIVGALFVVLWIIAEIGRTPTNFALFAIFGVAIALTRLAPIASLVLVPLGLALQIIGATPHLSSTDWPTLMAVPIVTGLIAARGGSKIAWWALGVGGASIVVGAAIMGFSGWSSWTGGQLSYWAFGPFTLPNGEVGATLSLALIGVIVVGLAWGCGWAVRGGVLLRIAGVRQAVITEKLNASVVELALVEERSRIAQEMHDVLAHSLAVIVAQADGARYLRAKRPAAVDGALTAIADSARAALVDVNGIIDGMLDGTTVPQPALGDVDDLVAGVEAAGLTVTRTQSGDAVDLAPGQQLAVYRILQEGFTNALRHRGRGSSVAVVFDWRGPGLSLQVVSSGVGEDVTPDVPGRVHRGIEGMRERARLAGGWLAAGLDENGDHRVTAFVPYRVAAASAPSAHVQAAAA